MKGQLQGALSALQGHEATAELLWARVRRAAPRHHSAYKHGQEPRCARSTPGKGIKRKLGSNGPWPCWFGVV